MSVNEWNALNLVSIIERLPWLPGQFQKRTQFRIWATQRLKEYLVQGYTLNQQRFDKNAEELQQAIALTQKAARFPVMTTEAGSGLVNIVSR